MGLMMTRAAHYATSAGGNNNYEHPESGTMTMNANASSDNERCDFHRDCTVLCIGYPRRDSVEDRAAGLNRR
jgi:hypothetical protein